MNLFPELSVAEVSNEKLLPMYMEWAFDFEKGELKVKHGKYYLVEGNEALKIWIYKALRTPRFIFNAYTHNYGSELGTLAGTVEDKDILYSEISRYIEEVLLANPYIISVSDFNFSRSKSSEVDVRFNVNTIYGSMDEKIGVSDG
jgi:hypothetical protein|nr:MAG TPA: Protein of unknown function (DUF2634) [Caudoviricetes sp.]